MNQKFELKQETKDIFILYKDNIPCNCYIQPAMYMQKKAAIGDGGKESFTALQQPCRSNCSHFKIEPSKDGNDMFAVLRCSGTIVVHKLPGVKGKASDLKVVK